jgi:hypothetical protein
MQSSIKELTKFIYNYITRKKLLIFSIKRCSSPYHYQNSSDTHEFHLTRKNVRNMPTFQLYSGKRFQCLFINFCFNIRLYKHIKLSLVQQIISEYLLLTESSNAISDIGKRFQCLYINFCFNIILYKHIKLSLVQQIISEYLLLAERSNAITDIGIIQRKHPYWSH